MKTRIAWCAVLGSIQLFLFPPDGSGAVFNIANGDVAGLKAAMTTANTNGEDDVISLASGGLYTLTAADNGANGLPRINADGGHALIIKGSGATIQRSTAVGTPNFRIFYINTGAQADISGLTIRNGNLVAHGGAIYVDGEDAPTSLILSSCTLFGNTGDYGGAIYNDGYADGPKFGASLTVINCTFWSNRGTQYGGAIWNDGSFGSANLTVYGCTFRSNSAMLDTGAIQHDGFGGMATGSISNSTFVLNGAGRNGGGIYIDGEDGSAALSISNCTLSDNSAGMHGGALSINNGGTGIASLQVGNTIFEDGASGENIQNVAGTIISQGYNLSNDAAGGDATTGPGGFLNHAGDKRNTDPLTDPAGLQDNGGATLTVALRAGSPALDQGKRSTIGMSSNDQRGEACPFDDPNVANAAGGDGSDIGAYEANVRVTAGDRLGLDLRVTFFSILEHTYEIQSAPTPSGPWTSASGTSVGTGGIIQITAINAFVPPGPRFFRVYQVS